MAKKVEGYIKLQILHVNQGLEILDQIGTRDQTSSYHINALVGRTAQQYQLISAAFFKSR